MDIKLHATVRTTTQGFGSVTAAVRRDGDGSPQLSIQEHTESGLPASRAYVPLSRAQIADLVAGLQAVDAELEAEGRDFNEGGHETNAEIEAWRAERAASASK